MSDITKSYCELITEDDTNCCAVIHIAKHMLADKFNIAVGDLDHNKSRKSEIVEARRFLMYFLFEELEMKKSRILDFVPTISNHATVIHHIKKMKELMELEKPLEKKYEDFRYAMVNEIF